MEPEKEVSRTAISGLVDNDREHTPEMTQSGLKSGSKLPKRDNGAESAPSDASDTARKTENPSQNEAGGPENTQTVSDAQNLGEKAPVGASEAVVPAWMRPQEEEKNRYDKYVPREDRRGGQARRGEAQADLRYAKYLQHDQEKRSIRRRDNDEEEGSEKRQRFERGGPVDDRRGGMRRQDIERNGEGVSGGIERGEGVTGNGEEASGSEDSAEPQVVSAQPYSRLATAVQSSQNYHTFQSHIANKENKDINSIVRSHYNQRTIQSKSQGLRTKLPIYKLRNFNNAVKYMLLGNHVPRRAPQKPTVLLDLCCGKGGDLNKAEFCGVDQYVGVDISDASVKEAFSRYRRNKARFIPRNDGRPPVRDSRKYNFEACFATGDCFQQAIPDILEPNFPGIVNGLFPVDCVLMQFSMHYSFESEDRVRTMLTNVARSLRPGGTFVGTIPSSDFIRDKIINKDFLSGTTNKFGNELYLVTFAQPPPADGVFRPPFGNKYDYFLRDAVDNVPEYVVPFEVFRLLCEEYGMTLRYKKNFIDIFNQEMPKYFKRLNHNLVDGMRRADGKYGAEGAEKEAVSFYLGFAFEKLG